ncbi:CCA tRNA nucleotidyltransferase [Ruminiclostridium cellulolyticum]|uniref:Polynucleotide adenylyltransferase/metal dependent phosphohydrolase n=1 Tax=Ruminiclostridium cellulolyticum (strain ATCC 35319 / DSM 5812 / JCM 6584 / H10) TaxID=394503 RepID=B8I4X8_RUMCH|nr:CCA tRNA nucleotidyltransferase [Ruminiclostridium cellulolyticum]ACL76632.1 polynucleotide adenylyltransferase/metal dependent phosphohydrolase [Ruminiclostridium cellulolyticum H10]
MNLCEKFEFPENAGYVIKKLNEAGYDAYLVGGCVRDSILCKAPYDWDITTNALPIDIKSIFDRTYDTGIKHGTVTVLIGEMCLEVTTYRIDGDYKDFRRPDKVEFTSSLREDLARRDFTINAMAYHPEQGLVDFFGGLQDLKKRIIKAVGDPEQRFREDALRMMRAIRFSAQLGFEIEEATFEAIKSNSALIANISSERIRDELNKTLVSENPEHFNYLHQTGILPYILPEFERCYKTEQINPYHVYNVADHTMYAVKSIENDHILRWTVLLHDVGKPPRKTTDSKGIDHFYGHQAVSSQIAEKVLNRLRFDKESIKKIVLLVKYHDMDIEDTPKSIRKAVNKIGDELFPLLLKVQKADKMAQNPKFLAERIVKWNRIEKIYSDIKSEQQCLSKKDMAVNGDDLIQLLGMKPGIQIREMLDYLCDCVLECPELNEKQKLLELAKKRMH